MPRSHLGYRRAFKPSNQRPIRTYHWSQKNFPIPQHIPSTATGPSWNSPWIKTPRHTPCHFGMRSNLDVGSNPLKAAGKRKRPATGREGTGDGGGHGSDNPAKLTFASCLRLVRRTQLCRASMYCRRPLAARTTHGLYVPCCLIHPRRRSPELRRCVGRSTLGRTAHMLTGIKIFVVRKQPERRGRGS